MPIFYGSSGLVAAMHMVATGGGGARALQVRSRAEPFASARTSRIQRSNARRRRSIGIAFRRVTRCTQLFTLLVSAYFPEWTGVLLGLTLLIALSRVILGFHYPTDVAAGAVLGGSLGFGKPLIGTSWLI